jgi:hypothetical protein
MSISQIQSDTYNNFICDESSFTLGTELNTGFLKNITFAGTLNKNKTNPNDVMQGEHIFTGLNNIAKQQR